MITKLIPTALLAFIIVGIEIASPAQPARPRTSPARTAGRASAQASQRSTAPALLGGRMYDQNGVNFARLIREDDFARRKLLPNQTAVQRRGQPGDMSVPREGRHIQYTGRTSGSVTGPDGKRYVIAQFRDLSNPSTSVGYGNEHRWSAGGVQFSQRIAPGDNSSYAEGVKRGWKFRGSNTIPSSDPMKPVTHPKATVKPVSTIKSKSAGTSAAHQSGGLIMDPPN